MKKKITSFLGIIIISVSMLIITPFVDISFESHAHAGDRPTEPPRPDMPPPGNDL